METCPLREAKKDWDKQVIVYKENKITKPIELIKYCAASKCKNYDITDACAQKLIDTLRGEKQIITKKDTSKIEKNTTR